MYADLAASLTGRFISVPKQMRIVEIGGEPVGMNL